MCRLTAAFGERWELQSLRTSALLSVCRRTAAVCRTVLVLGIWVRVLGSVSGLGFCFWFMVLGLSYGSGLRFCVWVMVLGLGYGFWVWVGVRVRVRNVNGTCAVSPRPG